MNISKEDTQKVLQPAVMIGGAVIAIGAGAELVKHITKKTVTGTNWIMPAVTLLVGVAAFSYAQAGQEVRLLPKTGA